MPTLLLKFHAAVIKEIPVDKTPLTIGRKPDNDIVVDNLAVSSHHARITTQGNIYMIEDLQSTNGTFVNEKRIITSALRHNDTILLGQHSIQFINPEEIPSAPEAEKADAPAKPVDLDATVVMAPERQKQVLADERPASEGLAGASKTADLSGFLKVIEGKSEQNEYPLTKLLTYIGKSETAAIKIKGLFAPDIAALISKRPNGYLLTAVKDGYPKLNNQPVSGQVSLNDTDVIEVAGIKFLFQLKPSA